MDEMSAMFEGALLQCLMCFSSSSKTDGRVLRWFRSAIPSFYVRRTSRCDPLRAASSFSPHLHVRDRTHGLPRFVSKRETAASGSAANRLGSGRTGVGFRQRDWRSAAVFEAALFAPCFADNSFLANSHFPQSRADCSFRCPHAALFTAIFSLVSLQVGLSVVASPRECDKVAAGLSVAEVEAEVASSSRLSRPSWAVLAASAAGAATLMGSPLASRALMTTTTRMTTVTSGCGPLPMGGFLMKTRSARGRRRCHDSRNVWGGTKRGGMDFYSDRQRGI